MSDDDLRGLVRDQLRAATEENRLESTTVRQIMDALEETYLVSLSGERKRFVREVVDEFIAERTRSAPEGVRRGEGEGIRRGAWTPRAGGSRRGGTRRRDGADPREEGPAPDRGRDQAEGDEEAAGTRTHI